MSAEKLAGLQQVLDELVAESEAVAEAITEAHPALAAQLQVAGWLATSQALEIVTGSRWDEATGQFIPPLRLRHTE